MTEENGPVVSLVPDKELIFVRGTEKQIGQVEECLAAYHVPNDRIGEKQFGQFHLVPLPDREHATPIQSTLNQLQLDHQTVQVGDVTVRLIKNDGIEDQQQRLNQITTFH